MKKALLVILVVLLFATWLIPLPSPPDGYVGSKLRDAYHCPSCEWAGKISEKNIVEYASPEEAEEDGRTPCKICRPDRFRANREESLIVNKYYRDITDSNICLLMAAILFVVALPIFVFLFSKQKGGSVLHKAGVVITSSMERGAGCLPGIMIFSLLCSALMVTVSTLIRLAFFIFMPTRV